MKEFAIGMDVGGTKLAAGIVDRKGKLVAFKRAAILSQQKPQFVIDAMEEAYRGLLEESGVQASQIQGIGLGFAGTVNGPGGYVYISSNLPEWDRMPLRDVAAQRLGLPVILENDSNACALGEYLYGAGRGTKNMCYVCFSTGYGLGIIINGSLYNGNTGTAGELSHVVIELNGHMCTCGKRGCLMTYASGVGISREIYDRIECGERTLLERWATPDRQRISGEVVAKAADEGDAVAQQVLHKAGLYFGLGLSIIVQMVNPELIVIGGGLTRMGDLIMKPAMQGYHETVQQELADSVQFKSWQLGDEVGVVGAASLMFV